MDRLNFSMNKNSILQTNKSLHFSFQSFKRTNELKVRCWLSRQKDEYESSNEDNFSLGLNVEHEAKEILWINEILRVMYDDHCVSLRFIIYSTRNRWRRIENSMVSLRERIGLIFEIFLLKSMKLIFDTV